jgi:hypothetical protein
MLDIIFLVLMRILFFIFLEPPFFRTDFAVLILRVLCKGFTEEMNGLGGVDGETSGTGLPIVIHPLLMHSVKSFVNAV